MKYKTTFTSVLSAERPITVSSTFALDESDGIYYFESASLNGFPISGDAASELHHSLIQNPPSGVEVRGSVHIHSESSCEEDDERTVVLRRVYD